MLNLARLHLIGDGIALDRARAAELRQQAATAGEPAGVALVKGGANQDGPAMVDVATWLGNFGRASEGAALLRREAEAGSVAAAVVLGTIYYNGQAGTRRNCGEAKSWWNRAAKANSPAALNALGLL